MARLQLRTVAVSLIALAFASPAVWFPNFWPTFLVPAAVFLGLQMVALRQWSHKETLFKVTDYIYYLLIGGIVALGSHYLLQAEQVGALDAILETKSLQQRIRQIETDLPILRSDLHSAQRSAAATDPNFVAQCRTDQMLERRRGQRDGDRLQAPLIDPCQGYFAVMDKVVLLPSRIASLEQELAISTSRLRELESTGNASTSEHSGSRAPKVWRLELEFRWVPMLLLIGIAIKLGKTTSSLCPLKR